MEKSGWFGTSGMRGYTSVYGPEIKVSRTVSSLAFYMELTMSLRFYSWIRVL